METSFLQPSKLMGNNLVNHRENSGDKGAVAGRGVAHFRHETQ
ncbi:hypothetical protein [Pseudomonas sp. LB3P58]